MVFIVLIIITTILQAVTQYYTAKGATIGAHLPVEFEYDSISLTLPHAGLTLQNDWKLFPLFNPQVRSIYVQCWSELVIMTACSYTDH